MEFLLRVVFLVSFWLVSSLNAQLHSGDECTFTPTGELGKCEPLGGCKTARESLRAGNQPQRCGFEGTIPIVCCTSGSQLPPYRRNTVPTTTMPKMNTELRSGFNAPNTYPDIGTTCPPLPDDAVMVEKTGQKAWDYCIDLASSVYPCTSDGFSMVTKYTRSNECAHLSTPLIVGGNATSPGEFPHMAALGYNSDTGINWSCGGSLISNRWVMTAAHCLKITMSHVRLGGGDSDSLLDTETHFTVIESIRHPDYRPPQIYNDIALLKLDRDVRFQATIRPACLHTGEFVNDNKALVSGWGATAQRGIQSNSLLKTTVEKFSFEDCKQTNPPMKTKLRQGLNDRTQFCYGHNTLKQDTCQGDSGGPLMIYNSDNVYCTYLVTGITSNGKVCGEPGFPAIYTRVSAFLPWIEKIVWP